MNTPVISIDVEDWLQSTWDRSLTPHPRAADNTYYLLDLLEKLGIKTTMFILGKFAETFPKVVKAIDAAGHEVASHGFSHIEVFTQTRDEFKADICKTKTLLEDLVGKPVIGHRSPDFSIVRSNFIWGMETIAEAGFQYDSSINPIQHPRYGIADFPNHPVNLKLANGQKIVVFPIASFPLKGKNYPVGGGGYHRLLPGIVIHYAAKRILRENQFVYYCHPYEFNSREFREIKIPIPLKVKLHQGLGRGKTFERRFVSFVKKFGAQRHIDLLHSGNSWKEIHISEI